MTNTPRTLATPDRSQRVCSPSARPARAQFPWAGARAVGMGGAQVAAVDDGTAAWANPAALGRLEGWGIQVFASGLAANRNNLVGTLDTWRAFRSTTSPTASSSSCCPSSSRTSITSRARHGGHLLGRRGHRRPLQRVLPVRRHRTVRRHLPGDRPRRTSCPGAVPTTAWSSTTSGLYLVGLNAREVRLAYGHGVPGQHHSRRRRGPVVFARDLFHALRRFRQLPGQGPRRPRQRGVRPERPELDGRSRSTSAREVNLGIFRFGVVGTSLNQPNFDVAVVPGAPATVPAAAPDPRRRRRHAAPVPDARGRRRLPEERHARAGGPEPAALDRRRVPHPALRLPRRRLPRLRGHGRPLGLLRRRRPSASGRGHRRLGSPVATGRRGSRRTSTGRTLGAGASVRVHF